MKKNAGKRIILCIVAFLTLLPLTYVFIVSCESKSTYYQKIVSISFTDFSFENYITMAQNIEIWIKIINTFLITVCVVVFTLLLAVPFAYIITKTDRKRRLLIMLILLAFSFMPEQVTILSKYKMFLGIGLTDSVIAVVLLLVSQQLSFTSLYYRVVVIRAPLQGLCYTVRDAVDWCSPPCIIE